MRVCKFCKVGLAYGDQCDDASAYPGTKPRPGGCYERQIEGLVDQVADLQAKVEDLEARFLGPLTPEEVEGIYEETRIPGVRPHDAAIRRTRIRRTPKKGAGPCSTS
jgi:hypothetical protein